MKTDTIFFKVPRRGTGNSGGLRPTLARWRPLLLLAVIACAAPRPAGGEGPAASTATAAALRPVPAASTEPVRTLATASIGAVGDVLMHAAVQHSAADHASPGDEGGYGSLWAPVADLLRGADLTFANLETPVAPRTGGPTRSFLFNADDRAVVALRRAGVGLVSIANNHILDQGRAGLEETVEELDRAGMPYVGAGPAGQESGPRILTLNGIRVAFLAYARFLNQSGNDCPRGQPARPCVRASVLDADRAIAEVRAAAASAEAVVVSLHWGDEYAEQPREQDVALAHRLAEAGAVIILGHHPHVLQPLEVYRRADGSSTLIAYSLGNFVSNQSRNYVHGVTPAPVAATRDGVLLRAELVRRDYGRGIARVELGGAGWFPLWTENDTADPERRAAGRRPSIRVVSVDRALAATRAELRALPDPLPPEQQARFVALRQREELLSARRAAIAAVLGEDLERTAPPPAQPAVTPAASR